MGLVLYCLSLRTISHWKMKLHSEEDRVPNGTGFMIVVALLSCITVFCPFFPALCFLICRVCVGSALYPSVLNHKKPIYLRTCRLVLSSSSDF